MQRDRPNARLFIISILLCLNIQTGCAMSSKQTPEDFNVRQFVVFAPEKKAFSFLFPPDAKYWMAQKDDLVKGEPLLEKFLSKKAPHILQKLGTYKRQYVGILVGGKHILYINFFCDDFGMDWKQREVMVKDGGDCYFNIKVNLDTGECYDFFVNGEA